MLKRRVIVVVDKDDREPEKTAMACFANVAGLTYWGTKTVGKGIFVKLGHENFPPTFEAVCAPVCFVDIRDGGFLYQHYPSWDEIRDRYADPSLFDEFD